MQAFNRFIAVLVAIGFVICAPFGVAGFNIDRTFLSAPNLLRTADDVDFYGAITAYTADQLHNSPDAPLAVLTEAEVQEIAASMLPREVLRPVIEDAFTQLAAYAHGEREDVAVSMATLKAELRTRFPEAMLRIVNRKPVCASSEDYGSYTCSPRPEDRAQYEQQARDAAAHAWGENVPDTYDFMPGGSGTGQNSDLRAAVEVMNYAPYVALALLALVAFFAVRGVRGLLLWIGVPLMITGLLLVVCWLLSSLGADEIIRNLRNDPANVAAIPFATALFDGFVRSMMIWAGIVAVTGFGMTIGGSLMPRAESADAA